MYLVNVGLCASRAQAQELIKAGRVLLVSGEKREVAKKPSQKITSEKVELLPGDEGRFVSRGGLKMKGALEHTGLSPKGFVALDVGISTGGFTDCLLQNGASQVVGVDVGHGQLASQLLSDQRVQVLERVNARDLPDKDLMALTANRLFDLVVIDVSFISLTLVLPSAIQSLKDSGFVLALVKPQFEVGKEGLGKGGIVKDESLFQEVKDKILKLCSQLKLNVEDYFASAIEGSDGNKEFFVFARK